jgi:copper resistance protein D
MSRRWFFKIETVLNSTAILFILMFLLFPSISQSQEVHQMQMEHGTAPGAHSSAPIPGSPADIAYSESMHRLNGIFVLLLGGIALLEHRMSGPGWLRWGWPLLFLVSGIYLAINSDPDGWPIGDKGFIASLHDPMIFQHKLAALILLLLGFSELLLRTRWSRPALGWVFPSLAIAAGVLLYVHSHASHQSLEVERQHLLMAGTALGVGATKFLSERFKGSKQLWPLLILLLGLELLFYRE